MKIIKAHDFFENLKKSTSTFSKNDQFLRNVFRGSSENILSNLFSSPQKRQMTSISAIKTISQKYSQRD